MCTSFLVDMARETKIADPDRRHAGAASMFSTSLYCLGISSYTICVPKTRCIVLYKISQLFCVVASERLLNAGTPCPSHATAS
jgi:hypothetical protein